MTTIATMAITVASITVSTITIAGTPVGVAVPSSEPVLRRALLERLVVGLHFGKQPLAQLLGLSYAFWSRSTAAVSV
jgi:hypothetical protein